MRDLSGNAKAFLEAGGYQLRRSAAGFIDMERSSESELSDSRQRVLVWDEAALKNADAGSKGREAGLLKSIEDSMGEAEDAEGFLLVQNKTGLSQNFMTEAKRLLGTSGGIRAPIEFFDSCYKVDDAEARRARTAIGNLLETADRQERVAQPFSLRTCINSDQAEPVKGDLVEYLETALIEPEQGPRLRIIEGHAGSGKTVALTALFRSAYREFIEAKKSRHDRRRPIVFLPEHLRGGKIGYVDDVIAAVTGSEVAGVVEPEQFKWLLMNGYAVWMFDGLDEFYSGSHEFFTFIEKALTAPGSKAQFIISTRDSLFQSSEGLRTCVERLSKKENIVEIYQLLPWNKNAWRSLAWLELEHGRDGGENSERVIAFVSALEKSRELAQLATLPFYCNLLLQQFKTDSTLPEDEFDALESMVNKIIDREQGKDIFRWQDYLDLDMLSKAIEEEAQKLGLPTTASTDARTVVAHLLDVEGRDILMDIVGSIAHTHRRTSIAGAAGEGLPVEDVRTLKYFGELPVNLDQDVLGRLRTAIVQFAFFTRGRELGTIDFTHEIVADFLAARYAISLLKRDLLEPEADAGQGSDKESLTCKRAVLNALGTAELQPNSLYFRYLAREIEREPEIAALVQSMHQVHKEDTGSAGAEQGTRAYG